MAVVAASIVLGLSAIAVVLLWPDGGSPPALTQATATASTEPSATPTDDEASSVALAPSTATPTPGSTSTPTPTPVPPTPTNTPVPTATPTVSVPLPTDTPRPISTSTPVHPDVVVAVQWSCTGYPTAPGAADFTEIVEQPFDETSEFFCTFPYRGLSHVPVQNDAGVVDRWWWIVGVEAVLTLRSPNGDVYHHTLSPPAWHVQVGDKWPP